MKKKLCVFVLLICFSVANAGAESLETGGDTKLEGLLPVAVILYNGSGDTAVKTILLIVVNPTTGKALKASLDPNMFSCGAFDLGNADSVSELLKSMGEVLQLRLDKYVCLETGALESMEKGQAKGKSVWDLIGLGFSMLDSVSTNLPIGQSVNVFRRIFAQKEEGLVITLPNDAMGNQQAAAGLDLDAVRNELYNAMDKLKE